jgi:hypothetical protein
MNRSAQPVEAGASEQVADPTAPMPEADAFSSGMVALERSPAALGLATLAGDLLYLNAAGERLFGLTHGAPLAARNLADICNDPGQLSAVEAVARDGRERNLVIRAGSATSAIDREKIDRELPEGPPRSIYRVNPRNGSPKIVLTRAVLAPDAEAGSAPTLFGTVQDITFMLRRVYGADAVLGEKAYEAVSDDGRRRAVLGHLRRALAGTRVEEEVPVSLDDDAIVRRYELTYSPLRNGAATAGGVTVFGIRSPGAVMSR